eukprot:s111_g42.t1
MNFCVVRGQEHDEESKLQVQPVVLRPCDSLSSAFCELQAPPGLLCLITSREQCPVAPIKRVRYSDFLAGYMNTGSDGRRQPAIALCVFEARTSRKVEHHANSIARHLFKELSEFRDGQGSAGGKLQKLQQEVEENIRSIAKTVSSSQTSPSLPLPEGFNVINAVQVAAQKVRQIARVQKKNWIWDLETVLPIDPKDAWRRLLSGEELCPEPRLEEELAEAAASRTQTRAEPEDSRHADSDVRRAAMETQEPMQWACDSDNEDLRNNGNNALGSFVQRQLDREKEIKRPTVRPVSVFTSFMPHGAPLGEGEGATGTWAGQAGQDAKGENGPVDPCIGKHGWHGYGNGAGRDGHAGQDAEDPNWPTDACSKPGNRSWHGHGSAGNHGRDGSGANHWQSGRSDGNTPEDGADDAVRHVQNWTNGAAHGHDGCDANGQPSSTSKSNRWQGRPREGPGGTNGERNRNQTGSSMGLPGTGPSAPGKRSLSAPAEVMRRPSKLALPVADHGVPHGVSAQVRASIIESMLEPFASHLKTDPAVMEILWRIFYENRGPQVLYSPGLPEKQMPYDDWVFIDKIFYTHENIATTFSHGKYSGHDIQSLAEELYHGRVRLDDPSLRLEVVRYEMRVHSLCNRRLYAFKCYQDRMRQANLKARFQVPVRFWPLDPVTAKFVLAYTTTCSGSTIQLRPAQPQLSKKRPSRAAATHPANPHPIDPMDPIDPWANGNDPWSAAHSERP